jgi:hypothetical protein
VVKVDQSDRQDRSRQGKSDPLDTVACDHVLNAGSAEHLAEYLEDAVGKRRPASRSMPARSGTATG